MLEAPININRMICSTRLRARRSGRIRRQAAQNTVFIETRGSIAERSVNVSANCIPCGQVLDIVDEQIKFARGQRLLRLGQALDDQRNNDTRLNHDPEQQDRQRWQQTPDRCEITVVARQRVQARAVIWSTDQRHRAPPPDVERRNGHRAKDQDQCRALHLVRRPFS
jgi:hypothetical protein